MEDNANDMARAVGKWRDTEHARLFAIQVGLAAETDPAIIRKALAKVFDLSQLEGYAKEILERTRQSQREAAALSQQIGQMKQAVVDLEKQIDAMRYERDKPLLNGNGKPKPLLGR